MVSSLTAPHIMWMATKSRASAEPIIVGTIPSPFPTPIETRRSRQRFRRVGSGLRPSGSRGSIGSSMPYWRRKSENASPCHSSSYTQQDRNAVIWGSAAARVASRSRR